MYFLDGGAVPRGGAIFIFTSLEGRFCGGIRRLTGCGSLNIAGKQSIRSSERGKTLIS